MRFSGDGAMVLVNAPVSVPDPALRAVAMASDMQRACRSSSPVGARWRARLGFGVGIAMGPATVGRIGSEGRLDYTAVGNVVNLASRLCAARRTTRSWWTASPPRRSVPKTPLVPLEARDLKGLDQPVPVFAVSPQGCARIRPHELLRVGDLPGSGL